jgi:hypothetical protein
MGCQAVEIPPLAGEPMDADNDGAAGSSVLRIGHVMKAIGEQIADTSGTGFQGNLLADESFLVLFFKKERLFGEVWGPPSSHNLT